MQQIIIKCFGCEIIATTLDTYKLQRFLSILRRDFSICWITLPADLKNWDFQKKKEKEIILPYTFEKLDVFGFLKVH